MITETQFGNDTKVFVQTTPASTWTFNHAFNKKPLLDISINYGGVLQKAFPISITHTDDNHVTIVWSSAHTGVVVFASDTN